MVGEAMPAHLGEDIDRLQPVLRSRYWLWFHVKVVTAAYGAFLLAWVMGMYVLAEAAFRGKQVSASAAHALYRCLQIGLVLMVAGTILGAIWADEAWGRYWGWDPKEVWALVIILVYLIPSTCATSVPCVARGWPLGRSTVLPLWSLAGMG